MARAAELATDQLAAARSLGARVLTIDEPAYPVRLRDLDLPPPVLYCLGELPDRPAVAIVGSRKASREGLETAELFARQLASRGLSVISGFAEGIDKAAHRGALSSGATRSTVAVLGCGIDVDYPRRRASLRAEMAARGALISEFPCRARPSKLTFPIRNRIIAALTLGTLVVQGARRSGSLITARLAIDLGRDVYAVPGSIFDTRAEGPNALIQDGALLVTRPEDIISSLPVEVRDRLSRPAPTPSTDGLEGPQNQILECLAAGRTSTADQLVTATGIPLGEILAHLLDLEIAGRIKRFPGALYSRQLCS